MQPMRPRGEAAMPLCDWLGGEIVGAKDRALGVDEAQASYHRGSRCLANGERTSNGEPGVWTGPRPSSMESM